MTLLQFASAAVTRWGALVALAAVMGGLAIDLLVLPQGVSELAGVRRRLRSWNLIAVVALILATGGEFGLRARTMSGGSLAAAIAAIPVVLTLTHFGIIWIARTAALGLLLVLVLVSSLRLGWLALLLAAAVALSTSLTGHAAAWGDLSITVLLDWIHLLAVAVWTGGLGALALVALAHRRARLPAFVTEVARRFSRLAGLCLLVVLSSGAYNAWAQVGAWPVLWGTVYGRVLAVKILVVLGIVWLGAINRYLIIPSLVPDLPLGGMGARLFRRAQRLFPGSLQEVTKAPLTRLGTYVRCEAALAIVVFACTAILGESTPARHAAHTQPLLHGTREHEAVPSRLE